MLVVHRRSLDFVLLAVSRFPNSVLQQPTDRTAGNPTAKTTATYDFSAAYFTPEIDSQIPSVTASSSAWKQFGPTSLFKTKVGQTDHFRLGPPFDLRHGPIMSDCFQPQSRILRGIMGCASIV